MKNDEQVRVIAIDDDETNLEIIETYFSMHAVAGHYLINTARTYEEADALLQALTREEKVALLVDENLAAKQKSTTLVEYARRKVRDLLVICTSNGPIELQPLSHIVTLGEYPEILASAVVAFAESGVEAAKTKHAELTSEAAAKAKKLMDKKF